MSNVYVERVMLDGTYRAIQNKVVIATGKTQQETADKAHRLRSQDAIFVERVRNTSVGSPDKWRRVY
jgi:hypothetical protein